MVNETAPARIDPALFRKVMGSFPTGVTVITTDADGVVHGMTVSAFMSGSLKPPLCVISIGKAARSHRYLLQSGRFGVSILARGQERLSSHFAGHPDPELRPAFERLGRAHVLVGAAASIAADIIATHDCGDHTVMIGHIDKLGVDTAAIPLAVHTGRYASLMYTGERAPEPTVEFW